MRLDPRQPRYRPDGWQLRGMGGALRRGVVAGAVPQQKPCGNINGIVWGQCQTLTRACSLCALHE
nr:MAG TPA: hypothetical protein [Caudoviricetes sp.]